MKKIVSIFVCTIMVLSMFTGCGTSTGNDTKDINSKNSNAETTQDFAEEAFGNIEPLAETQRIVVGALSSSTHGFTTQLISKLGGFEKANLDAEVVVFGNGPILVEAMASGDCDAGPYGLGGTLAGTIGQDFVNLAVASRDYHALQFYSPNDTDISKAGPNKEIPGVYGTAENWKGKEIFLPLGTTLHYMLNIGLENLGLTSEDVKLTHMEVPNINTALRANKCEIGAVWTNYPYGDLNNVAKPVMTADEIGVRLVSCIAANPGVMKDEKKLEAVQKWIELYFAAVEWMYATEENRKLATDWFIEWNEENGIPSVRSEIESHLEYQRCYTLEENIEMFETKSDKGDYSIAVEYNVEPLKFFIEQGNYKEEDLEKFAQPQYFDSSIIEKISKK